MKETYYTILEVSELASQEELRIARNRLIYEYHPDRVPPHLTRLCRDAKERTLIINEAYGVLANLAKKKLYDAKLQHLRAERQSPPKTPPPRKPPPTSPPPRTSESPTGRTKGPGPPSSISYASRIMGWLNGLIESEVFPTVVWVAVSFGGMFGSIWLMEQVDQFSFVWWLGAVAFVGSIPGVVFGVFFALVISIIISIILLVVWAIISLIGYFIKNPY